MNSNSSDTIPLCDLYVVVSTGYMIGVSADGPAYFSKEKAEENARERQKQFPSLKFSVMDMEDYIREVFASGQTDTICDCGYDY